MTPRLSFRRATVFLLSAFSVSLFAAGEEGWTLREMLQAAREGSPTAAMVQARVEAAVAGEDRAKAGQWPTLTLNGSYVQTDEPMTAFGSILNQGTFDNTIDFNAPGTVDALNARLEARYRLYTGGRQTAGESLAAAGREQAEAARDQALLQLEAAIVQTYFSAREARSTLEALEASRAALEESLRVAKLREEAGDLHPSERLNLEAAVAERASQILATEEALDLARRRLAVYLGHPTNQPLMIASADPALEALAPATGSATEHPSVRLAAAAQEQAKARQSMVRGTRLPAVEAFARYQYDRGWKRNGDGDSWLAGIGVSIPIFDGFESASSIRASAAERRAADEALQLAELDVALDQAEARSARERALKELELAETRFAAARSSAELSRSRFAAQSLDSTALLAAEARLTDAQTSLERARLNERATVARILLSGGQSLLFSF